KRIFTLGAKMWQGKGPKFLFSAKGTPATHPSNTRLRHYPCNRPLRIASVLSHVPEFSQEAHLMTTNPYQALLRVTSCPLWFIKLVVVYEIRTPPTDRQA